MNRITSTVTFGNKAPRTNRHEWQIQSNPWTAQIRYQRRQMTIPFWTGPALGEPETWDVVYCLLSDARCVYWGETFEDFCDNLGYDHDSRKAWSIYQQVIKQSKELRRLLGDDFEDFIEMDEDEIQRRCR